MVLINCNLQCAWKERHTYDELFARPSAVSDSPLDDELDLGVRDVCSCGAEKAITNCKT
jgi:hypothetical protein